MGARDDGYDADNLFRNSQAQYFLPSVHEWYKAAFYDPDANGGAGGYWNFPTGSDSVPTPWPAARMRARRCGINHSEGPADITHAGGLSPYGTMAQAGNVWEWEETASDLTNDDGSSVRGLRGGDWLNGFFPSDILSASVRLRPRPVVRDRLQHGFRVASIPEPSSLPSKLMGMMGLLMRERSAAPNR